MNTFQSDLLLIRESIKQCLRKELMGPGSEISYPDEAHELISESPSERYSVGILYTQQTRYTVSEEDNEEKQETESQDNSDFPEDDDMCESSATSSTMYKDDAFNDEVNLAQQNKPSSMGMTFFIDNDIDTINIVIDYAKYNVAKDDDIIIPYDGEELKIPAVLDEYIEYDSVKKIIKKKSPISYKDLSELFELNAIEQPELFTLISNINQVFKKKRAYRRCPYNERAKLSFVNNKSEYKLENANATITAVKHNSGKYPSITIMLVNNEKDKKFDYIYQPKITVCSSDNNFNFVSYNHFIDPSVLNEEEQSLELLYRNKFVYGTGHGVAVDWTIDNGAGELFTEYLPTFEVPKINLDLRRDTQFEKSVAPETLSMKYLSDLDKTDMNTKLDNIENFINCYKHWIDELSKSISSPSFDKKYKETALKNIDNCNESFSRMIKGISILRENEVAYSAFLLANRAMFMQRIHGVIQKVDHYPGDENLQEMMSQLDYCSQSDANTRWRPFQLAFLIMSIRSIIEPECEERDIVDLIWFPTGGGKTEAYLGLTAFTIFYRRLSNPEHGGGTAVIMRYTLRLLTSQQFTRASTLICACEKIRSDEETIKFKNYKLGTERITIGLWIGGDHIPNKNCNGPSSAEAHLKELRKASASDLERTKEKHNKFQVLKCPWCGTKLTKDKDKTSGKIVGEWGYNLRNKKHFYLCCPQEGCEFNESLPIQIIDEELYLNPPTLLFGTVDKFAMMAWNGQIKSFYGGVNNDAPDLIIQDELHLISGPLGSMVGLYETAIDYICSAKGNKPKIIASTATIRQADKQCRALYNREVRQFPAQGLDASDSYFSKEVDVKDDFGRLYCGIMPSGKTKVMLQARITAALLQHVSELNCSEEEKDQFFTFAIYFNSLRELGKASSVVADDVKDFIHRKAYRQVIKKHSSRGVYVTEELTSRVSTAQLNDTLDRLEHLEYSAKNIADKKHPIDVLLASNMISVGVDVARLNLMMLQGQPKSVSEYIQASSRIGRSNPGIAITLYDATKSRDRSYYEQFHAFHESFYKFVEPTGITPFSAPARDRALHAVIISALRQSVSMLNDDDGASMIIDDAVSKEIEKVADFIYERVKKQNEFNPEGMIDDSDEIKNQILKFIDFWKDKSLKSDNLKYGDKYIAINGPSDAERLIKRFEDTAKDESVKTSTSLRNVDKTIPVSVIIWEDE